jgi:predicted  nucleic acid-binding Zn-ribbon protein
MTKKLETTVVALHSRLSALNERKAEARFALDLARADRQKLLLEADISDDKALAKVENAVDAATLRLSGLGDACAALAAQIADAEQEVATEAEREKREAAAKVIAATADTIQERFELLLRDIRSLGESLVVIDDLTVETAQFGRFLRNVARDIEVTLRFTPLQLRGLARAVERGEAQIPRQFAISAAVPAYRRGQRADSGG